MLESPASCFAFRYGAPLNMTIEGTFRSHLHRATSQNVLGKRLDA